MYRWFGELVSRKSQCGHRLTSSRRGSCQSNPWLTVRMPPCCRSRYESLRIAHPDRKDRQKYKVAIPDAHARPSFRQTISWRLRYVCKCRVSKSWNPCRNNNSIRCWLHDTPPYIRCSFQGCERCTLQGKGHHQHNWYRSARYRSPACAVWFAIPLKSYFLVSWYVKPWLSSFSL